MNLKSLFNLFAAGALALMPLAVAADSSPAAAAPRSGILDSMPTPHFGPAIECEGIERQFVLLNSEVVSGEPVEFRLLLKAVTQGTGTEFIARLVIGADVQFFVIPPGGQPYRYEGMNIGETVPTAVLEMDNVPYFRYDFRLGMDHESLSGAAFDIPGVYLIRVFHACNSKAAEPEQLDMGTFELTVKQPAGDDMTAFNILRSDFEVFQPIHSRDIMQRRGSANSEGPPGSTLAENHRRLLQRVVDEAPNSRIAPHAMFLIALDHFYTGREETARLLLQRIQSEYRNTTFYEEALFQEIKVTLSLNDEEGTENVFKKIWTDPLASQLIYPGSNYWKAFVEDAMPSWGSQWMLYNEPGPDPLDGRRMELQEQFAEYGGLPPIGIPFTVE